MWIRITQRQNNILNRNNAKAQRKKKLLLDI